MNKQAGAIVISIMFAVGTAAVSYATDAKRPAKGSDPGAAEAAKPMKPSDPKKVNEGGNVAPEGGISRSMLTGELLKIDGKDYVVRDQSGKEVHFQIDERTMMNANPKVGDKIRANLMPQGYAYSVNLAGDSTQAGTTDKQPGPASKSDRTERIKK